MRWNCIYAGFCLHLILVLLTSCSAPADSGNNDVQGNTNANQRPVAVILPATEQSVIVGDRIRFRGDNSYDPDNNTVLAYQWTFSGAQTSITQSGISNPTVTFNQTGSVTTTLTVSDSLGLRSVPVSVRINVAAVGSNLPPNGSISHDAGIGANGSTGNFSIISGTTAVFQGSGSDPENDTLTYLW
ncbi:MAG: PKD domain-containing protein, partial [Gammaproteobacteria bacterium]|nr:PKD domain-containing protein [Gammaproteobacteria bacterium]